MKKITVPVDEEVERRRRLMQKVAADIKERRPGFRAADNLSREELYDRCRARREAARSRNQA